MSNYGVDHRELCGQFLVLTIAIEEEKYIFQFTLEELTGSLLSCEARLKQEQESLKNSFITQYSLSRGQGGGR